MSQQRKNSVTCKAALAHDWGTEAEYVVLRQPIPPDLSRLSKGEATLKDEWRLLAREEKELFDKGLGVTMASDAVLMFNRWRVSGGMVDPTFTLLSRACEIRMSEMFWLKQLSGNGPFGHVQESPDRIDIDFSFHPLLGHVDEPCFYLGTPANWAEWLVNSAVNLIHLDYFPVLHNRRLVLGEVKPFHTELLEALGFGPERWLSLAPEETDCCTYSFSDLAVPIRPALKPAFAYLARRLKEALCPAPISGPERVYLTRAGLAPRHRVFNEDEIADLLRLRGFEVVDPFGLSLKQTLELLGNARIIVAPGGAGMGNFLLANPKAEIINLLPRYFSQKSVESDPQTHWSMTSLYPFLSRMQFVLGDYDLREQQDYVDRHRLSGFDIPFHYDPAALDLALLQAEKMWRLQGTR
ncbi:MAG: glycosyltransferase family 61 protein [Alphaproteobacteria bacterium]|nr:glycosyltransferase family 61 protein [Alphaproteobacteria bacterium]